MKPKNIEVIDSSNYEFILYRGDDDRLFLSLSHESGFGSYSQVFELSAAEVTRLNTNKTEFITELRNSFNYSTKTFAYVKPRREIVDFHSWSPVKLAQIEWHEKNRNAT